MNSRFKVLEAPNFEVLTGLVQAALDEGWVLHGEMHIHSMGSVQAMKIEAPAVIPSLSAETVDALQSLRQYTQQDYSVQSAMLPMMRLMVTRETARGPQTVPVSEFVTLEAIPQIMNALDS